MCTPTAGAMLPYGLKIPSPYFPFGPGGGVAPGHLPTLDIQRSQLNDYNVRVQLGLRNYQHSLSLSPFHAYLSDPYAQAYFYKHDPRARFVQEEPKPSHSYIGLIGMAILQSKEKKLVLSDIYQWILDNYAYFRTRGPGWRNSIRHNLSLNDCFIKSGRSANGKGHYWAVHPANVDDFERGDFRRRRAQRKVRRHMGLSVPDDDDSPSPSPTQPWVHHDLASPGSGDRPMIDARDEKRDIGSLRGGIPSGTDGSPRMLISHHHHSAPTFGLTSSGIKKPSRKRLFDMASLLAPDDDEDLPNAKLGPDKMYEDNSITLENNKDYGILRMDATRNTDSQREQKYIGEIGRTYENSNMSDDDGENEEDDDNIEEIQVTSDDETSAERSAILAIECDREKRLTTDSDNIDYQETDNNNESNIYAVCNKDSPSPSRKEDVDATRRMSNGIIDKENIILRNATREIYAKSHIRDNGIVMSPDHASIIGDRRGPQHYENQEVPSDGLPRYQSPISHGDQAHSVQSNTDSNNTNNNNNNSVPESPPHSLSPTNRPDRLTVPLSVAVNSPNFSSPVSQSSSGMPRQHPASEHSETTVSSQTSFPFSGGPHSFKSDVVASILPDLTKPINGAIRRTLDHTTTSAQQVSDIVRLQAEGFSWQPFPKELIRERFSAFNVLDARSHGLVGQFHQGIMRGIAPFTQQAMLAHSSAFTHGISSPLQASNNTISVAAIQSPGNGQSSE